MSKASEDKKDYARILYMSGEQQKDIARKAGVSEQTMSRWVAAGDWDKRRAAQSITRPEIVNNLLKAIGNLVENLNEETDPAKLSGAADKLAKLAATIEKLDKKANVVDAIEVFIAFGKWLQFRSSVDKELTPELIRLFNKYQDLYITDQLSSKAQ
jgi:transposase